MLRRLASGRRKKQDLGDAHTIVCPIWCETVYGYLKSHTPPLLSKKTYIRKIMIRNAFCAVKPFSAPLPPVCVANRKRQARFCLQFDFPPLLPHRLMFWKLGICFLYLFITFIKNIVVRRLYKYISILLLGCIVAACDVPHYDKYDRFAYICAFYDMNRNQNSVIYYKYDGRLFLNWEMNYSSGIDYWNNYKYMDEQQRQRFHDLCSKYGDVHYNGYMKIERRSTTGIYSLYDQNGLKEPICATSEVITGVEIVSDMAWDATHPAGTSLNDLFDITYYSFAPYIASGYDAEIFKLTYGYTMALSDITAETLSALDANRTIKFFAPYPASGDAGTLAVTVSLDSGETITFTASAAAE